ncbi:MAG: acetyltransferase [Syntrophales bacterium LBB04]|nr:acetyltransferase [Syntrophales bacterium LBB04]
MPEGGGGHCKACIDVIESLGDYIIAGVMDLKSKQEEGILSHKIFQSDDRSMTFAKEHKNFLVTIGHVKNVSKRKALFEMLTKSGGVFPVIISPLASVSKNARIGNGTIVMHGARVNSDASVGDNCIINTGAIVEHDAVIGDHCHISTGSIVNGGCVIGNKVFVGSKSVLRELVTICDGAIIGAGAVVVKSIHEKGTYVGNPARLLG